MRLIGALIFSLAAIGVANSSDDVAAEFQQADKALNDAYRSIVHRLADDPGAKARLVHAQRAWIAFRDAECDFRSGGVDGGSAAPAVIMVCRTQLTSDRTTRLNTYLNCEEGDLACPVPAE